MAENKTAATEAGVETFLATVEPAQRQADARRLAAMMAHISGEQPRMWGRSIIGFGSYHYRYESGREGDSLRVGFSPRKDALVLYLADGFPRHVELLARLGKHTTGKSCLYVKKLADVDEAVLDELIGASQAHRGETYPK